MSYLGRSAKLSLKAQEKVSFLATAGQTVKTGLSYVPSFVEVYVNGILLTDTTDFTATNGNSVTFTVALALNDEVTVVSLKTFTVADHYTKSDANTLLAAKATNTAVALKSPIASPVFTGPLTSNSAAATNIVAKSTNGNGGYMNYQGLASNGTQTFAVNHNGTIFTTSGLAVGGNGAANTLDDYEEGTFTLGGTGIDTSNSIGIYTKIGRMCHTQMWIRADGNTDGTITGLPFTAGTGSANFIGVGTIGYINGSVTGVVGNGASTTFVMYNGTSTGSMSNGNQLHLGYTYTTT